MIDSIKVTCGQCQHFTRHDDNYTDEYDNNGLCSVWMKRVKEGGTILELSHFFIQQLGGCSTNDETPRHCNKFVEKSNGKYNFVVGD